MNLNHLRNFAATASLIAWTGVAGCGRHTGPAARYYQLKGTIISVDSANQRIVVDHDAIPGFMAAMTMPYAVKDAAALNQLSAGDSITARVVVTTGGFWLDRIAIQKQSAPAAMLRPPNPAPR